MNHTEYAQQQGTVALAGQPPINGGALEGLAAQSGLSVKVVTDLARAGRLYHAIELCKTPEARSRRE